MRKMREPRDRETPLGTTSAVLKCRRLANGFSLQKMPRRVARDNQPENDKVGTQLLNHMILFSVTFLLTAGLLIRAHRRNLHKWQAIERFGRESSC